ncbi:MAG: hypothetical protein MET45_20960 [Nostoc sp. LLA-1]|nr:hypothetical protein [Cyanocohniella sp. LLY]
MTASSINSADLVDFHCHLDLYPNYLEVMRECEELGIKTLTVTNAPCVWTQSMYLDTLVVKVYELFTDDN